MIRKAFVMQVNPDAHEEYRAAITPSGRSWKRC
jgi:L-rhamnose mutarotase